jgi:carbonic anhydrase/acetyltransferase-like protein (isoleucine patch superfamily)
MILPHLGRWPKIHETAFLAPSADVIGDVEVGELSSIWFQVVMRGDVHSIRVGRRSNVQDHSMLHCTRHVAPLLIGDEVTIGHRVTLHSCTIRDRVLVGMGAIILDQAEIGEDSIVGAGALVTKGVKIPPRSLVLGSPGKVVRELKSEEIAFLKVSAENYVRDSREYLAAIPGARRLRSSDQDLESFEFDDETLE